LNPSEKHLNVWNQGVGGHHFDPAKGTHSEAGGKIMIIQGRKFLLLLSLVVSGCYRKTSHLKINSILS
jgi:hypothetical protein